MVGERGGKADSRSPSQGPSDLPSDIRPSIAPSSEEPWVKNLIHSISKVLTTPGASQTHDSRDLRSPAADLVVFQGSLSPLQR